ncbi:TIR domain-containing protein [Bacillus luti]|uniref:Toll/interleukin-1 receptor domain-containing protein n=1 Tax=Bacillus luti TaxID=2026191 RepID=A0A7V7S492_9BACI|nr:TIR domain-containing protein [Bacillus luti]KAB2440918.1 toll/interleukin-1 receptor domain-containing protein [Bacillus luti]
MKNVFISYGHDEHACLAEQLRIDLEKVGFNVWIDGKSIKVQNYWDNSIEKGIDQSHWIIVLMTPHSMRRPEGVCLDEISYARFQGKDIVPIMVQQIQPPLPIARIQWLDLQNYQQKEQYQKGFEELCKVLNRNYKLGFEGELTHLRDILAPMDDKVEIGRHMEGFIGRDWLYNQFQDWLENQNDSRVFWVKGQAGVGKSAFSAKLALESKSVVGVHFFKHNDSDRRNPKRALCSLAYYLATQIPEYMEELQSIPDLRQSSIAEKNPVALFNYLFVEPLNNIPPQKQRCVLILDALDEAKEVSELLHVIGQEFDKIPNWLGLVITSRPETDLVRRLGNLKPFVLDTMDTNNIKDIESYLKKNLEIHGLQYNETQIAKLIQKSEGVFLYITEIMKELRNENLHLDNLDTFPTGLKMIYLNFFERQFPDKIVYSRDYRPLLELVIAALGPLPTQIPREILGWDEYQEVEILEGIGSLFYSNDDTIEPFHKSIKDWLIDKKWSYPYWIVEKNGQQKLMEHSKKQYLEGTTELLDYQVAHFHQHLLQNEDWTTLKDLLADKKFIIAKIKAGQSMELLDFYEEVIQHPHIDFEIRIDIEDNFRRVRLPILFDMHDHFAIN